MAKLFLKIKIKDIKFKTKTITLNPENTKGRIKYREIPIAAPLLSLLTRMEAQSAPKDYYLFGAFDINHRIRYEKRMDFKPAPNKIKRDTATKK